MINICDAIMGSGKSSAAITYMNEHPDDKFVYITPYLGEATRIKEGCPSLHFVEPSNKVPGARFSKVQHTLQLLEEGRNIATTHAAFKIYDHRITEVIRESGYTLIIDEAVNVLSRVDISSGDVCLLKEAGYIGAENGRFVAKREYTGKAFTSFFSMLQSREMIRCEGEDDSLYYWILPPELLTASKDVFVLTYLFEGYDMYSLLQMCSLSYRYIGVSHGEDGVYRFCDRMDYIPEYTGTLSQHIHILDDDKINSVGDAERALSMKWFLNEELVGKLKKNIYNYGSYLRQTRALRGKSYTIPCPLDNVNDTEIYIYSASQIKSIGDLSGLKVGYAEFSLATKLQALKLGDKSSGYTNGNLMELYLGNNALLKEIDVRNCPNLGTGEQKAIDLSGCQNIEHVYFDGTSIGSCSLPNGGILKTLHLPGTITNLTIRNQMNITDFDLPSSANITTLRILRMEHDKGWQCECFRAQKHYG